MDYEIDYKTICSEIKKNKAKKVLLQLPDGLKPDFKNIADKIENECGCSVFIWANTCFGSCDIPLQAEHAGIDMIVHIGHEPFKKRAAK